MMNRRGFLKLFGKGAAAGAVYAMMGSGVIERIAPEDDTTERAEQRAALITKDQLSVDEVRRLEDDGGLVYRRSLDFGKTWSPSTHDGRTA